MTKIVFDARESGTTTGRYVDKLLEYLHKADSGYEFVVLAKQHRLEFIKGIAPSFQVVETAFPEFSLGEQLGFMKQIKSFKPDLAFFPMVQQPILYRGKVVTMMQDLTTVRFRNPSKNWLVFTVKQAVYKVVNKWVAKKSDFLLTPTEFVKRDIMDYCHVPANKITVTLEAADKITEKSEPVKALEGKQFIFYTGRPLPHKNLKRLIDAFVLLQKDHPDLILALAGKKDPIYEGIEQGVKERGIKNVVFTGFVSDGQLRWMYENVRAYIFPSLSEGFGLPGLEAMMHGAPVASSNATCLPEVYGDAAHYFDPLNVEDMAAKIAEVIDNESLRKELIQKGSEQSKKYSWQRMAEQTLTVYKQALK